MVSFTWHTACLLSLVAACDKAATCTDTCAASCVVVLHLPASSSPSATTTVPSAWHVTDQEKPRVVSARINGTAEWTRTAMRGAWRVRSVASERRREERALVDQVLPPWLIGLRISWLLWGGG